MFSKTFIALSAFVAAAVAQTPPFTGPTILETGLDSLTCLTASDLTNGAAVTVEPCNVQLHQSFVFSGGAVTINGTKCLDVTDGVNADGTKIQIWDCTTNDVNQQWYYTGDNRSVICHTLH